MINNAFICCHWLPEICIAYPANIKLQNRAMFKWILYYIFIKMHSTLQENTTLFIEVQQFSTSCGRFNQRREPTKARAH